MASESLVLTTWIVLAALMATILFLVFKGASKTKSMADYAVGNIVFSPYAVGLALAASMTSAATFIINPGFIALNGISAFISFGIVFPTAALISLVVLTKQFRKQGTTIKALTLAQWMGNRYKSKNYGLFFAVLSLLLITFIVLIAVGLTKVISKATNVNELYILIGLVVFIFGYMMFGGANSMVYTNTIQALVMVVVAILLIGSGYEHFSNGVHGFLNQLEAINPKLIQATDSTSLLFRDWFEIGVCQFIVGIAVVCQPHIITKSLLLKNDTDVNKYLVTGIIVEILFFLVVFTGFYARLAFPDLTLNGEALKMDGIIPAYVIHEFPVYLGLIVILGLIAAGLSTLEGLIQSLSTTITSDLIKPLVFNNQEVPQLISINKIVIAVLGIATIVLSYQQIINPSLSVGIFAQNGVYAYFSAAFLPVIFGIFVPKASIKSVAIASVTAVLVHFGTYYLGISPYLGGPIRNPGVAAAYAITASVAIGFLVHTITQHKHTLNA